MQPSELYRMGLNVSLDKVKVVKRLRQEGRTIRLEPVRKHFKGLHINMVLPGFFNYTPNNNFAVHIDVQIGFITEICPFCKAKKWPGEPIGLCCLNSKVILPPQPLRGLHTGTHSLPTLSSFQLCFPNDTV